MMTLEVVSVPVTTHPDEALVRDANDCPILRAAIAANCDVILTGDKDLLEANLLRPAPLSAAEFLKK